MDTELELEDELEVLTLELVVESDEEELLLEELDDEELEELVDVKMTPVSVLLNANSDIRRFQSQKQTKKHRWRPCRYIPGGKDLPAIYQSGHR